MHLVIGSDHAGYSFARELARWAGSRGLNVEAVGAKEESPYDYPDASDEVAREVLRDPQAVGVLVCGTGIGVSIRANRYEGVRAANCTTVEMAELARLHNHANVLCLGARILDIELAKQIVESFLQTKGSGEERHMRRVAGLDGPICAGVARRAGE